MFLISRSCKRRTDLCGMHSSARRATQKIDLLLAEGMANGKALTFTATLTTKGPEAHTVKGKTVQVSHYVLSVQGQAGSVDMDLMAVDRHLLAWNVPTQKYTAVREGYEGMAGAVGRTRIVTK